MIFSCKTEKNIWRSKLLIISVIAIVGFSSFTLFARPFGNNTELSRDALRYLANKEEIVFAGQSNYPPFEFVDRNGKYTGLSLDIIRWIANEYNFKIKFVHMPFSEAQLAVQTGKADVLTSFFYSVERDRYYDFSHIVYDVPASIFIRSERSDIHELSDLAGKKIAVQRGDLAEEFLRNKKIDCEIKYTYNFAEAINMVVRKEVDVLIGDEQVIHYYIYSTKLVDSIKKVGEPLYVGRSSFAVQEGNGLLLEILNKGLERSHQMKAFEKINNRWLGMRFYTISQYVVKYQYLIVFILVGITFLLLFIWFWNLRLRRVVSRRTSELFAINQSLEAEIVRRKRMEDNLRESEEKYRVIVENQTDLFLKLDTECRLVYISPSACRIFNFREQDVLNRHILELVDPESVDLLRAMLHQLFNPPYSCYFEHRSKSLLGGHWFSWIGTTLLSPSGKVMEIIAVGRNIDRLKATEEDLANEKERLMVTLRSIADGVIVTDISGEIIMINNIAQGLLDWPDNELIGQPLAGFFTLMDNRRGEPVENPVDAVLRTNTSYSSAEDLLFYNRNNQEFILDISAAPIRDKENHIAGVVLVFHDVTEKNRIDRELQRTQKIESIGILAGGIAHDFNNILAAILGNISIIRMDIPISDRNYLLLEEAEKACIRAKNLTQQLLTFAKGGSPIKESASIQDLIRESAEFVLRGSKSTCAYKFDNDLWLVEVDKGQFSQVIQNLIINSNQAMPFGGIIEVSTSNVIIKNDDPTGLAPGLYVKIAVRDEGTGISPRYLQKIFDPYFTTKESGKGLGLAIIYSIIKHHNGIITVDSELGKGAVFTIYLPALENSETKLIERRVGLDIQFGEGKILFMDDEEMLRRFARQMLDKLGFTSEFVADGAAALESYKAAMNSGEPFDLVIMDLTIPGGMGGKVTIEKLLDIDPHVRAVVTSGYSNDAIMANYLDFGFRGVLAKPFTLQDLSRVIQSILTGKN